MILRRLGTVVFGLVLVAAGSQARADHQKASSEGHCILDAIGHKLGLNDQQRDQYREIHDRFDKKAEPIRKELGKLRHEQHEAMRQILTEQQRNEVPGIMKMEAEKALKETADKLGLSDEQRKRAMTIAREYEGKCAEMKKGNAADKDAQMHALKVEGFEAFCGVLTEDQRVKLPGVLKDEMHTWHSPEMASKLRNDIADRLQLTADQRKQFEKVCSDYGPKIEKQKGQLKQLWMDEHAAVDKVLTDAQRTQFRQLLKMDEHRNQK